MFHTIRIHRRLAVIGAGAAAVAALALSGGTATAAPAAPRVADTAAVQAQVADGTLLAAHGTAALCPRCDGAVVTAAKGSTEPLRTAAPGGYSPAALAKAYHLPTGNSGAHTTIAIIDAGVDSTLASDLAKYRSTFGLPACTVASGCLTLKDYTGGAQPKPQTGAEGKYWEEQVGAETSLDLDMASAACPSCQLLEISVPWQDSIDDNDVSTGDFTTAVATATKLGADVVSISYGYTPDAANSSATTAAAVGRPGTVVVASTGDSGFNGGSQQPWPSDLPNVVAAGGITLKKGTEQSAWNGAGSGCSGYFAAATGQPASVAALCGGHRASADVSADADPDTGVAVYDTFAPSTGTPLGWGVIGGTSASAPYIAGLYGRVGQLAGVHGPAGLYAAPKSAFHDVVGGDNLTGNVRPCSTFAGVSTRVCHAFTGWDGPTGLGTPVGLTAFQPATTEH